MAEIKKITFGNLIEEFDPNEKSSAEFDVFTGKFSVEDLLFFFDCGFEIWALENFSFSGRVIMKRGEKLVKRHLKIMKECRGKFIESKLKRKFEILTPDIKKLISTYTSIDKDAIIKYPLVNLEQSDLPEEKKEEIKKALSKKFHASRSQMIEIFNRNTQNKIKPHEPLYKSKAICKTNFTKNINSKPEKIIMAIDISASTMIDNLNYFLQYLGMQVKNYFENVLEIPMDILFFDDRLFSLKKGNCIFDNGGTVYQNPFEYCLSEAEKSEVEFILISDGMPNDENIAKDLAKKFKVNKIKYYQIIVVHPVCSVVQSYHMGSIPLIESEDSFFKEYEIVFEEICKNAGGSQIVINFPEFLYYLLVDFYDLSGDK